MFNSMVGGLAGIVLGMSLTAIAVLSSSPNIEKARVFERGNQSIIRLYSIGADGILVRESTSANYVPLNEYLKPINDPSEKKIEEERIKQTVRWYYE